jgi:hypothetical protein
MHACVCVCVCVCMYVQIMPLNEFGRISASVSYSLFGIFLLLVMLLVYKLRHCLVGCSAICLIKIK